jgi:DNA-binding CsgD family transcriptional regulator
MTTGFDYIFDSLFPSRKRSRPEIVISADEDTLDMLRELTEGQDFSAEELAALLLKKAVIEYYQTKSINVQHWDELSQRQREVAALACLNNSNAEIAQKLDISLGTVKTHMREILRKFNVRGRHQLRYMLKSWDFSGYDPTPKE